MSKSRIYQFAKEYVKVTVTALPPKSVLKGFSLAASACPTTLKSKFCPFLTISRYLPGVNPPPPLKSEPLVPGQEFLDDDALVDGAAVPEQHHRPPQMVKQVPQEFNDLNSGDVLAMETEVKTQALPRGGYRKGGDCGNPIPPVAVSEDRGLPDWRPSLTDVRDEEKPAFVEEGEMGTKFSGFFLYPTTRVSSSGRWPSRPAAWRGAPASAMSIRNSPSTARYDPGGSEFRNACGSAWKCAAVSTNPLYIQPPEVLVSAAASACASVVAPTAADGQKPAWPEAPWPRLSENFGPSAPQNLWKNSRLRPRTDKSCQPGAWLQHAVCVIRVREGFLGVSYPIG